MSGIDEFFGSMAQPDFVQAINKCIAGSFFHEPAERNFGHIDQSRHFTQRNCFVVIVIHVLKCLLDPSAVVTEVFIRKCSVGQSAYVAGYREIMQDRH